MRRLPFTLQAQAPGTAARATTFKTLHGDITTPLFMPVGTKASVKGLRVEDLKEVGSQILLANTYHLHLRPGPEVFTKTGGIHKLTKWSGSFLTDSGGFQIFSLPHARTMSEEGAAFRSYIDGTPIHLTPELSIETQKAIGSDIMMVLDQCIPSTADYATAKDAMELTHRWAYRSLIARGESPQALFGIVQGALHKSLRKESVYALAQMDFDGYAIGGLAVGETRQEREDYCEYTAQLMPKDKPRYLMGVGTPIDLLEAVHRGVDMFDCIIPTALSQQGVAYTSKGRLRLMRGVYKFAEEAIDPACSCYACKNYSKAYLHHLHKSSEPLGWQLNSIHNLAFYHKLMATMRQHIFDGTFLNFYRQQRETLVLQDEERPPLPRPTPKPSKDISVMGAFALHTSRDGFHSIEHVASGEVMHPKSDPNIEAERLYVEQAQLAERITHQQDQELIIWDVGLGAAYNAMAAIRAYEKTAENPDASTTISALRMISFENDLNALRLAAANVRKFRHLKHAAPHVLLKDAMWQSKTLPLRWELLEGDFREEIVKAPAPHFIFYDPYSYKTNHDLWTLEIFREIFERCKQLDTELYSYTASTRVRAAMLAAGFFVAKGLSTGAKMDTTLALTEQAVARRARGSTSFSPLCTNWLGRWERSQAKFPFALPAPEEPAFELMVRGHPQFK